MSLYINFATFADRAKMSKNPATVNKASSSATYSSVTPALTLAPGVWALFAKVAVAWPANTDAEFQVIIRNVSSSTNLSASGAAAVRGTVSSKGEIRNTMYLLNTASAVDVEVGWTLGGGSANVSIPISGGEFMAIQIA